jgi:NifU-like protein involved in Fe-S cluster formation
VVYSAVIRERFRHPRFRGRLPEPEADVRLGADIRPTRMRCVTLPISVLRGALAGAGAAS